MRTVFIDASNSMSGTAYEMAVEHAKAFETPSTPALVVFGPGDANDTTVGELRPCKADAGRMAGAGLTTALDRVLFKDSTVVPIVYTDADDVAGLAAALGDRPGEVRMHGADRAAREAIAAQLDGQHVLPLPDMSLWEKTDVSALVQSLSYMVEEADGRIAEFRAKIDENMTYALERSDTAMRTCAVREAAVTTLDLLRTIGTRTIGGGQSRLVDFAMVREMQRNALGCAVSAASSSSSSPATNLMRQAQLQAAWRISEMLHEASR
jgi:hypothetical protein